MLTIGQRIMDPDFHAAGTVTAIRGKVVEVHWDSGNCISQWVDASWLLPKPEPQGEPVRLFEPAPTQLEGQIGMML